MNGCQVDGFSSVHGHTSGLFTAFTNLGAVLPVNNSLIRRVRPALGLVTHYRESWYLITEGKMSTYIWLYKCIFVLRSRGM